MPQFKIAIGSDHHGRDLRSKIVALLTDKGYAITDVGSNGTDPVDYPDIAARVAGDVGSGAADRGILICGSGIGMAIAANKIKGVRAAHCYSKNSAEMTRKHNDANVVCLSDATISHEDNLEILQSFLTAEFEGGRHARRVEKIAALEG